MPPERRGGRGRDAARVRDVLARLAGAPHVLGPMSAPRRPRLRPRRSLAAAIALIALAALLRFLDIDASPLPAGPDSREAGPARTAPPPPRSETTDPAVARDPGAERLVRAYAERESGFMVSFEGTVAKVLPDDRDGSRHQRFLVRAPGVGRTILVAHNVDLAERAPVAPGLRLRLRGQYEWNERGGVLHWTHHDPDGSHPGGWIEIEGRRIE